MTVGQTASAPPSVFVSASPTGLAVEDRAIITQWQRRWRRFTQNRLSLVGATIIVLLTAVAILGPLFTPYPKDAAGAVHIGDRLKAPSEAHWMGTDDVGRDVLTRLVVGSRL